MLLESSDLNPFKLQSFYDNLQDKQHQTPRRNDEEHFSKQLIRINNPVIINRYLSTIKRETPV